jgi:hypothetical protein
VLCFGMFFQSGNWVGIGPHIQLQSSSWMWGQKNDSANDRGTSPLKEQVFGVIPLVPLFTISF